MLYQLSYRGIGRCYSRGLSKVKDFYRSRARSLAHAFGLGLAFVDCLPYEAISNEASREISQFSWSQNTGSCKSVGAGGIWLDLRGRRLFGLLADTRLLDVALGAAHPVD